VDTCNELTDRCVAVSMHSSPSNMMASATHDLDAHPCTLADDQHSPHLSELVKTPRPPLTIRGQRIAELQRDSVATRGHVSTIRSCTCRHILLTVAKRRCEVSSAPCPTFAKTPSGSLVRSLTLHALFLPPCGVAFDGCHPWWSTTPLASVLALAARPVALCFHFGFSGVLLLECFRCLVA